MDSNRLMYGSIGAGILVGILMLVLFGWLAIYGWLVAGVVAGMASRGSGRGFLSGLIAGIVVSAIAVAFALFIPVSTINTLVGYVGNQYLSSTVFAPIYSVLGLSTTELLKRMAVDLILIPAVGGFIGGSVMSNGYFVEEVEEHEQPSRSQQTARIVDDENDEVSS